MRLIIDSTHVVALTIQQKKAMLGFQYIPELPKMLFSIDTVEQDFN